MLSVVSAFFLAFGLALWVDGKIEKRKTCSDFETYADALEDYRNGNTGLDGPKGKKGVPCENLIR